MTSVYLLHVAEKYSCIEWFTPFICVLSLVVLLIVIAFRWFMKWLITKGKVVITNHFKLIIYITILFFLNWFTIFLDILLKLPLSLCTDESQQSMPYSRNLSFFILVVLVHAQLILATTFIYLWYLFLISYIHLFIYDIYIYDIYFNMIFISSEHNW